MVSRLNNPIISQTVNRNLMDNDSDLACSAGDYAVCINSFLTISRFFNWKLL
jgi:hypothetical protein